MATEDINISPAARRAAERAADILRPHLDQEGVADLHGKLRTIANPEDPGVERLAGNLTKVAKATMDVTREQGGMSLGDRAQNAAATRDAQARYLREMSPAGAAAWEAGRVA